MRIHTLAVAALIFRMLAAPAAQSAEPPAPGSKTIPAALPATPLPAQPWTPGATGKGLDSEVRKIQVGRGQTLSTIARLVRPDTMPVEQAVAALIAANPELFAGKKADHIESGQWLKIPRFESALKTPPPPADTESPKARGAQDVQGPLPMAAMAGDMAKRAGPAGPVEPPQPAPQASAQPPTPSGECGQYLSTIASLERSLAETRLELAGLKARPAADGKDTAKPSPPPLERPRPDPPPASEAKNHPATALALLLPAVLTGLLWRYFARSGGKAGLKTTPGKNAERTSANPETEIRGRIVNRFESATPQEDDDPLELYSFQAKTAEPTPFAFGPEDLKTMLPGFLSLLETGTARAEEEIPELPGLDIPDYLAEFKLKSRIDDNGKT